ncbi:MAG: MobF family relaxase [Cyanobacteria bacterium J06638_22]
MICSSVVVHSGSGYERYLIRYMTGSVVQDAEHGLALGYFAGSGAKALGLENQPIYDDDIRVKQLYRGDSPITGEILRRGMTTTRTYIDEETGTEKKHKPVTAIEFCFSAPPDFSTFFGTTNSENRSRMLRVIRHSLPLDAIESNHCFTRTGAGGKNREPAKPIFACFTHFTSRDLDPQVHVHAQLFSTVIRQDGQGGALDTRALLKREVIFDLGQQFRDRLQRELSKEFPHLECYSTRIKNGTSFGIKGIPPSLSNAFSHRRTQIEAGLRELEHPTAKQVQKVVVETRPKKETVTSQDALFKTWRVIGLTHGFDANRFEADARARHRISDPATSGQPKSVRQTIQAKERQPAKSHCRPRLNPSVTKRCAKMPSAIASKPAKRKEWLRAIVRKVKDSMTPEWLRPIGRPGERNDARRELARARQFAEKRHARFQRKMTALYATGQISPRAYKRCINGKAEVRSKTAIEFRYFTGQIKLSERLYLWHKNQLGVPKLGVPKSRAMINLSAATGNITRTQQIRLLERSGHIMTRRKSHRY